MTEVLTPEEWAAKRGRGNNKSCPVCTLPAVEELNRAWRGGLGARTLFRWLSEVHPEQATMTEPQMNYHFTGRRCAGERDA